MKLLIATVGLPRSGKTTCIRISNYLSGCDALHGQRFETEAEPMVWTMAQYMVRSLFLASHEIVVFDATNTTRARRDALEEWSQFKYAVCFHVIDIPEKECLRRADKEIIPIIKSMAAKYEPLQADEELWIRRDECKNMD